MTPRLAVVCALALACSTAPASAAAPRGELVIVATGDATGTVTLPAEVEAVVGAAEYRTKSPYVVFAFIYDGWIRAGTDWVPGRSVAPSPASGRVPAGRSTVRVLAEGPVTIHVPVRGIRGRHVVRLRSPLRGAVSELVDAEITGSTARSTVAVTLARNSWTLHGYLNTGAAGDGRHQVLCLWPADCVVASSRGPVRDHFSRYSPQRNVSGDLTARLVLADVGTIGKVRHVVLSMPIA